MNTKLVSIGNSKGVRLPKKLIADWSDDQALNIQKQGESIIISPIKSTREDWAEQIKSLEHLEVDSDYLANDFDLNEWNW